MSPYQPSTKEEEYFLKQEAEKLKKAAEDAEKLLADNEKAELKALHYMRCPKCGMELKEIVFRDIHIDECFSCGGVWLDCGELEQIVAKDTENVLLKISGLFKSSKS